ncbi:hypothetical protein RJT34_23788 [Clitoria ternatea]|uniref:Uncharacterized protein n=1 Tax=Clitoria ternatea TaxID=43366 RepID=A0AAN9IGW1_CLITE
MECSVAIGITLRVVQHSPRPSSLEYFPFSPGGSNEDKENEDLEEHPLEGLRSNLADVVISNPAVLPDLPDQLAPLEFLDMVAVSAPGPALSTQPARDRYK